MPGKDSQPPLHVEVLNVKGEAIKDAKVTLRPTDNKFKTITLPYDNPSATYVAREAAPGDYEIEVSHRSLQGQSRDVTIGVAPSRELVILGKTGSKTYFIEKVRVPVDADPELLVVTITHAARADRTFLEG